MDTSNDSRKLAAPLEKYFSFDKPFRKNIHKYFLGILLSDIVYCIIVSFFINDPQIKWIQRGMTLFFGILAAGFYWKKIKIYRFFVYLQAFLTIFSSFIYAIVEINSIVRIFLIGISIITNGFFLIDNISIENAGNSHITGIVNHKKNMNMLSRFGDSTDEYKNLD